jgi:hypothetical protein
MDTQSPSVGFRLIETNKIDDTDNNFVYRELETMQSTGTQTEDMLGKTISIQVAPAAVLAAAAVYLAESFARRLGENLADKLVEQLFGKNHDDAAFQAEVLARLDRIEKKIDGIITALIEIRQLIQKLPRQVTIDAAQVNLSNDISTLNARLRPFLNNPKNLQLQSALAEHVRKILDGGSLLMRQGKEYHVSGVQAMAAAFPCFSRLIQVNKAYASVLGEYGNIYSNYASPWLDPNEPSSFESEMSVLIAQKNEADIAMNSPPNRNFLICIQGPFHVGEYMDRTVWYGQSAMLLEQSSDGSWAGGGVDRRARAISQEAQPSPEQFANLVQPILGILPWWPVELTNEDRNSVFARMHARIDELGVRQKQWQPKIDELNTTIKTVEEFMKCCDKLKELAGTK